MSNLIATLKPYLDEYGYWAVFGVTLLENLGIPMPGQTMLMAGALLASQGECTSSSFYLRLGQAP